MYRRRSVFVQPAFRSESGITLGTVIVFLRTLLTGTSPRCSSQVNGSCPPDLALAWRRAQARKRCRVRFPWSLRDALRLAPVCLVVAVAGVAAVERGGSRAP